MHLDSAVNHHLARALSVRGKRDAEWKALNNIPGIADINYRDTLRMKDGDFTVCRIVCRPPVKRGHHQWDYPARQFVCTNGNLTRIISEDEVRAHQHYRNGRCVTDIIRDGNTDFLGE